jgi:hypothetical protein
LFVMPMHALYFVLYFKSVIFREVYTRNQCITRDRAEQFLKLVILLGRYIVVQHKSSKFGFEILH